MGDEEVDQAAFDAWRAGDLRRKSAFDTMWERIMGSGMDAALSGYARRAAAGRARLASGAMLLLALGGGYKAMPWVELRMAPSLQYAAADGTVRKVPLPDGTQLP